MTRYLFTIATFALAACSSDPATTPDAATDTPAVTDTPAARDGGGNMLYTEAQAVMTASCGMMTFCHSAMNPMPSRGLVLTAPDSLAMAIGRASAGPPNRMPLITPGDPMQSYIIRKMDGTHAMIEGCMTGPGTNCGQVMPFRMNMPAPIPAAQIDIVRRWVMAGAPRP